MTSIKNSLIEKLDSGKNVYGTCITSTGPLWPRAAKTAGLDFVFIDTEHVPLDRNELTLLCQNFTAAGIVPIVRIPSPDPFRACQAIDGDAVGIVIPYIKTYDSISAHSTRAISASLILKVFRPWTSWKKYFQYPDSMGFLLVRMICP